MEGRTATEAPRTMGTACCLGRKSRSHSPVTQLRMLRTPPPPVFPSDTPMPATFPRVKVSEHRRGLAKAKVPSPSGEVSTQAGDHLVKAQPSVAAGRPEPAL